MNSTFFIALSTFLMLSTSSFGQKKFEKESRISKSDLPQFAEDFASIFTNGQRIKWYLEEGLDRNSIEAKYKRNGRQYSVEFDTLGTMEDVEIIVNLKDIPSGTRESILQKLKEQSDSYKIDKIQIQYSGSKEDLENISLSGECASNCTVRYELVVRIRKDKQLSSFEYLFSEDGALEKRSEIIIQTSSNLEY
jgi:hypothetical protein